MAPVLLALATGPVLAQSPDPAKRDEWALSMSHCMSIIDRLPEKYRDGRAETCRMVADSEIQDDRRNRFSKYLSQKAMELQERGTGDVVVMPPSHEHELLDEMAESHPRILEGHIRHSIIEVCQAGNFGIPLEECERIAGLDRLLVIEEIAIQATSAEQSEEVAQ